MYKVTLSANLFNAIIQYLDTCPAQGVRHILNAMEHEVKPQIEAAQAAAQAEAEAAPKAE